MTDYETVEEQKLHELLVTQAGQATVPADLLQKISHREAVTSPNRHRRVLMVAATLAVAIGFASWAIAANTSQPTTEAASGMQDFLETLLASPTGNDRCVLDRLERWSPEQMIVWVKTDATEEQSSSIVTFFLEGESIESVRFVDQAETYAEFKTFWADSPEVLEAVSPEDLPTSYRVRVGVGVEPSGLAAELDQLDGVLRTDFGEPDCS